MAKNNSGNNKTWIRVMCLLLGALMVLSVVFMLVSALKSYAYTEGDDYESIKELIVGLKYGKNAVQTVDLYSESGFDISLGGKYTLDTKEKELIFSADGNEYQYNKDILVNPENGNGGADESKGINIVGGYHVAISEYRAGATESGNDNPVYIENGSGGQGQSTYSFTKENIDEYIKQFKSIVDANNGILRLDVQIFPAYIDDSYYIMVGSCSSLSKAEELKSTLELVFSMEATVQGPDPEIITIHNIANEILFETDRSGELTVEPVSGAVIYDGNLYNGTIGFNRNNAYGDALNVLNVIATDDYLKACLSVEYTESTDEELLKTLAVVYRTNICSSIGEHSADGFDVCTEHHCRKYIGSEKLLSGGSIDKAVDATNGEIITYSGKPIHALFSESCGSSTVSSADAIAQNFKYLRSSMKSDINAENTFEEWTRQYSSSDLTALIRMNDHEEIKGSIKTVTVNARGEKSLYVTSITFTDIFGYELTVTGSENIRAIFGGDLPSAAFAVSKAGKPVDIVYTDNNGAEQTITKTLTGTPGYFIFAGEGNGSGVGLDIKGAGELSSSGKTYKDIISVYYDGTEIKTLK